MAYSLKRGTTGPRRNSKYPEESKFIYYIDEEGYTEGSKPYLTSDKENLGGINISYWRSDGDKNRTAYRIRSSSDPFILNLLDLLDHEFQVTPCNHKCDQDDTHEGWYPDCSDYDLKNTADQCFNRLSVIQNKKECDTIDTESINTSYNCERLLYYYMCKYGLVYCTEIVDALKEVEDLTDLSAYPYYNILSFGCGGYVDLLAFEYLQHTDSSYDRPISYQGFDMSEKWAPIQKIIQDNISQNITVKDPVSGPEADVTTYFDPEKNNPPLKGYNIFIIPYLMSVLDMSVFNKTGNREGSDYKNEFHKIFDQWIRNIIMQKPQDSKMLILINDVPGKNNYATQIFDQMLTDKTYGLNLTTHSDSILPGKRFYFKDNYLPFRGSEEYKKHPRAEEQLFPFDSSMSLYGPIKDCQSYQLIIEVE